jgi:hypothetical protein
MSNQEAKYYEELQETFDTVGWRKHIMEDVFQRYEQNSQQLNHGNVSAEALQQLRGAQQVLKSLLDYEAYIATLREGEELTEEAENDAKAAL